MKISEPMKRVLENLHAGRAPCCHVQGMSQSGGYTAVLAALYRRGLIDYDREGHARLTLNGRAVMILGSDSVTPLSGGPS